MGIATIALTNGQGGVVLRDILEISTYDQGTRFVIDEPFGKFSKSHDGSLTKEHLIGQAPDLNITDAFSMVNSGDTIVADSATQDYIGCTRTVALSNFRKTV